MLTASGVIGFWPANSTGDDIELYTDESRSEVLAVVHTLRQQGEKAKGLAYNALSDFIAQKETGVDDYFGGFAVTSGTGIEKHLEEFRENTDDYSSLMLKALEASMAETFDE